MTDDMSCATDTIELRGPCPRDTVDVIDAFSLARSLTRTQLVNEILGEWVRARLHENSVLNRVARVIPVAAESGGKGRS